MPPPQCGEASCNGGHCLSVRLFVCAVPDPMSRSEGHSKLKIGRREAGEGFAHYLTKKSQILAPASTWRTKIKMITFYENYVDNITLQPIA